MRRLLGLSIVLSLFGAPAFAAPKDKEKKEESKDDEDDATYENVTGPGAGDFKEDDEEETPPPKRIEEGDEAATPEPEPDDLDFSEGEDDTQIDFKDDSEIQGSVEARGPGEDTAQLYRDAQKKNGEMTPDEELIAWEAYLKKYPKSLFRDRIETRQEELSALLFGERVPGSDKGASRKDAAMRELNFATPIQFGSIDTRTRASAGFDIGIPNFAGGHVDFEYAFLRQLSAHVGLCQDLTNSAIALGGKYALLKSARTNTLLSAGLDFKVMMSPAFVDLRPAISFGQRFDLLEGLDVMAQVGTDLELRDPFGLRMFGGLHLELQANKTVSAFVETTANFKDLGNEAHGPYRFLVASFGLRFTAVKGKNENDDGRIDVGLGANTPYSINYWGFYRGAISAAADWNL